MKPKLLFDFSVNEKDNTIIVKREFMSEITRVWNAWTKSELLDKWWAPKPYFVKTKFMDFSEGGKWFYAMISPEGEEHWCRFSYTNISNELSFSGKEVFCDNEGNERIDLPQTFWTNVFSENAGITTVSITLKFSNEDDLNAIIEMGFKEGFEMCLSNLDELLESIN